MVDIDNTDLPRQHIAETFSHVNMINKIERMNLKTCQIEHKMSISKNKIVTIPSSIKCDLIAPNNELNAVFVIISQQKYHKNANILRNSNRHSARSTFISFTYIIYYVHTILVRTINIEI